MLFRSPSDPGIRTPAVSEQFGVAVLSTRAAFPEALALIDPLVVRTNGFYVTHRLHGSNHPETNPREALRFIDLLIEPDAFGLGTDTMRDVLNRIAASAPDLRDSQSYRRWDQLLRVHGAV